MPATSFFWPVIAATTLAFFAMVGFEDSVNMAEETKDPTRIFPKVLLTGLGITGDDLRAGVDLGDHAGLARRSSGRARRRC